MGLDASAAEIVSYVQTEHPDLIDVQCQFIGRQYVVTFRLADNKRVPAAKIREEDYDDRIWRPIIDDLIAERRRGHTA